MPMLNVLKFRKFQGPTSQMGVKRDNGESSKKQDRFVIEDILLIFKKVV